jgi:hypothetical protein
MCTMQNALCLQNCNFGSLFFQVQEGSQKPGSSPKCWFNPAAATQHLGQDVPQDSRCPY